MFIRFYPDIIKYMYIFMLFKVCVYVACADMLLEINKPQ